MIFLILIIFLTSCSSIIPEAINTIDDIATDQAIKVEIDKSAMTKHTDVKIDIEIINNTERPKR